MDSSSSPVFIIGGSRTGSEMLKTMLSASPELDFADELFLLCPRWLHKDLDSNIREHVGDLAGPDALDRLMELLFSGVPYGWFWSVPEQNLDATMLREELKSEPLSLRSIFRAIMVVHARMRNKNGIGAKFPTHYSRTDLLLEWFPNCRLIHTTRFPKAVYASQASKYITADQPAASKAFLRFKQFVHINIQTTWTARLHLRLRDLSNYRLVRYEDVVENPEKELKGLCDFLNVEFLQNMLQPNQYGSSFSEIGGKKGVEKSSLERWRSSISPVAALTMDALHGRSCKILGY